MIHPVNTTNEVNGMNTPHIKARQELRAAANKLTAYLDHCGKGLVEFDAAHASINQTEDAIRQVKFLARAGVNVQAEGADALQA